MLLAETDFVQGGLIGAIRGAVITLVTGLTVLLKSPFWKERRRDHLKAEADRANREAKAEADKANRKAKIEEREDSERYKQLKDAVALYAKTIESQEKQIQRRDSIIEQHQTVIELLQQRNSEARQELAEQRVFNSFMYQHLKTLQDLLRSEGKTIPTLPEMPQPRQRTPPQLTPEFVMRQTKQNVEQAKAEHQQLKQEFDSISLNLKSDGADNLNSEGADEKQDRGVD